MTIKKIILPVVLFLLFFSADAQFNYLATNAQVFQGVYNDLGTLGNSIDSTYNNGGLMDYDDTISSVQNIGFDFVFNGVTFTNFVLSSNGFIQLGTNAPGDNIFDFLSASESNIIAPFSVDLQGGTNPEYRVYTSGVVGSRVCTIQFKNLRDYNSTIGQYNGINFQIKLYEGNNNIDFIYGTFTPTITASALLSTKAGIKGTTSAESVNAQKSSLVDWLATGFVDGPYVGNFFNNRNSVLPSPGLTCHFVAVPLNAPDAKVSYVYSLGEIPIGFGFPHVVKTLIKNTGNQLFSNLSVYLNVTGANSFADTQTIASLAPGATTEVNFDSYTSVILGLNNITVSIPNDANSSNNSQTYDQRVNNGLMGFANSAPILGKVGFGSASGVTLTKYYVRGAAVLSGVRVYISTDSNNIGRTVYAEATKGDGAILSKSANVVLSANDLNKYKEFPLLTSIPLSNSDIYVGLAQNAYINSYYPISYQNEGNPARTNAYYSAALAGGPLTESNVNSGRYMIQAVFGNYSVPATGHPFISCSGGDTLLIASSNGSVYQWQINRGSGFVNISDSATYSGTNNDSLLLIGIPSAWYGYQFACKVDGNLGAINSLQFTNYWTGAVNNAWEVTGNWSCGVLPDVNTDVIIPSGTVVLSSIQSCRSIFINTAASFTSTSGANLTVAH